MGWNSATGEGLVIDPVRSDLNEMNSVLKQLSKPVRWIAVIDTHTHADHISGAAEFAELLQAPLLMSDQAPSRRVQLRVSKDLTLSTAAGPLQIITTPGHTPDGLTVFWGPFIFAGDTLLYGDCGRDDLPGGDPERHFESLQKIRTHARPDQIFFPGHDRKGRASSWKTQLELNPAFQQDRETFVRENGSWTGPAPALLKESLFENFK